MNWFAWFFLGACAAVFLMGCDEPPASQNISKVRGVPFFSGVERIWDDEYKVVCYHSIGVNARAIACIPSPSLAIGARKGQ